MYEVCLETHFCGFFSSSGERLHLPGEEVRLQDVEHHRPLAHRVQVHRQDSRAGGSNVINV
jgi:hypothetical protein